MIVAARGLPGVEPPRRATAEELQALAIQLRRWRTPPGLARLVAAMRRRHGDCTLDQPGSLFREAFVASRCAAAWRADSVRLGADPPDFELRTGGRIEAFEVAEVVAPGRRRGDELKAARALPAAERGQVQHIPQEQWTLGAAALAQVADVVRRKLRRAYPTGTDLVLYLNIWPVAGAAAYQAGLAAAVAPALSGFRRVWLLNDGELREVSAG